MWRKLGIIIRPDTKLEWARLGYAAVPTVEPLAGDRVRVYFCSRDAQNRSRVGWAEIDLNEPGKVLARTIKPVLGLGRLGTFDDNGVTATWVVRRGSKRWMFYVGWNKGATVRMILFAGLAVSSDGGRNFRRVSESPVLERDAVDPFLTATVSVLRDKGVWRMWYVSGEKWEQRADGTYPHYNIKYAESRDLVHWRREGKVCIDFNSKSEHAIARPCVIKQGGLYRMWYCHKGSDYRLGYAESRDGLRWRRLDGRAGLPVSKNGWDSQMISYPFVHAHKGKLYLFYNGNEYGKEGIGLAIHG